MFQWDKSINAINIPAGKVIHLFRSMRDVQLALPGVHAQQASAYLCQYQHEGGVGTFVAFHLHKSHLLAFYFSDPRVVAKQKMDSTLDQGLNFVESMGFLMTDQDLHLLDDSDQEMLWSSLPLMSGLPDEDEISPQAVTEVKQEMVQKEAPPVVKADPPAKSDEQPPAPPTTAQAVETEPTKTTPAVAAKSATKTAPPPEPADNVDDLLAAVEAMRAKRPGLRARKLPPSAEELERRRLQLRQNVGRILASL